MIDKPGGMTTPAVGGVDIRGTAENAAGSTCRSSGGWLIPVLDY